MLDLDRLERIVAKATPGPWEWFEGELRPSSWIALKTAARKAEGYDDPVGLYERAIVETDDGYYGPGEADRDLIVALRNAVPELIAEIKRLREA